MTVNAINPNTPEVKDPEKLAKGKAIAAAAAVAGAVSVFGTGAVAGARSCSVAAAEVSDEKNEKPTREIGRALGKVTLHQGYICQQGRRCLLP